MITVTHPGIFYDFDPSAYLADPCPAPSFSQSIGKVLLEQSPAHARLAHPRLSKLDEEPQDYTAASAIGDAAHALLLGRGKRIAVADFDSWRTKAAQEFKADAISKRHTPILTHHMARAYAMVEAAKEQTNLFGERWHSEAVLAWQEDGLWLRTMIDMLLVSGNAVVDYKTSGLSCAPHVVEDRPSVLGWDIQAAMHERGLNILDPNNAGRRFHYYVNQENEPPYALTVIEISEADLTMGRKKLAMSFDIWSRCMKSHEWPRYPAETVLSRPRGWTESRFLEREIAHEERKTREPMLADLSGG